MCMVPIQAPSDAFTVSGPLDRVVTAMCDARVWYPAFCPHDRDPDGALVDAGKQTQRGVPGVGAEFSFTRTHMRRRSTEHAVYHEQIKQGVTIELKEVARNQLVFDLDEDTRKYTLTFDFASTSQNKTSITLTYDGTYRDLLYGGSNSCMRSELKTELNNAGRMLQGNVSQSLALEQMQMR